MAKNIDDFTIEYEYTDGFNDDIANIDNSKEIMLADLKDGINHGIRVSNLAGKVAKVMGLDEEMCYDIAVAGLIHDIGKLELSQYLYGRDKKSLNVEEMQYMRMHSKISYDIIQHYDFSYLTLESVLYHHENFDGTGYPENLKGTNIPIGARVIKVVDTFVALTSDRPYRTAFDIETAIEIMIDEIKNYDMEVFIAFQRVINTIDLEDIIHCDIFKDCSDINKNLMNMI